MRARPPFQHCLVTVLALVALLLPVPATPGQEGPARAGEATLVHADDALARAVARLCLAAQTAPPPAVSPLPATELERALLRIPAGRLSPRLQAEHRRLLELTRARITPDSLRPDGTADPLTAQFAPAGNGPARPPAGRVGAVSTLEGYFHSGSQADEWRYAYPDRTSLLTVPVRVWPLPNLYVRVDVDLKQNYTTYPGTETINPDPLVNVPLDVREVHAQFPDVAVLSAAGRHWSVQWGRDRAGWGLGETGSLILGDHNEYYDFVSAALVSDLVSYRALYVDLEPWTDGGGTADERAAIYHRLEGTFFPWLTATANELMLFTNKPMELRYLNPFYFMHNYFIPGLSNSLVSLELALRPLPGLEIYGHFAMDQIQSGLERERGTYVNYEPEAFGYLAGARYTMPIAPGWITMGTEWVFTDPWMFLGRTRLQSLTYRRRVQAENVDPNGTKIIVERSLGYPEGSDYYGITLYTDAVLWTHYRLTAQARYAVKGENTVSRPVDVADEADALRETPSGPAPETRLEGRLEGRADLARFPVLGLPARLEAAFTLDLIHEWNDDQNEGRRYTDVQFSPSITFSVAY